MDGAQPRFIALQPDPRLTERLFGYKQRTHALVGPQLFLEDPPHLTVYLALYPTQTTLLAHLEPLARQLPTLLTRILGWHVFQSDPLTGNHTLVCAIHPDDQQTLRGVQQQIVEVVAPRRDVSATRDRFGTRLQQLSVSQQAAIAAVGFPYFGEGWIPHFTVASIRPDDWEQVFDELQDDPPHGEFYCPALVEYLLVDGQPHQVGTLLLSGSR